MVWGATRWRGRLLRPPQCLVSEKVKESLHLYPISSTTFAMSKIMMNDRCYIIPSILMDFLYISVIPR